MHITVSEIYSISFDKFLQRLVYLWFIHGHFGIFLFPNYSFVFNLINRLEKSVKTSAHDVLPFNQKYNLIEDLKKTSDQFKEHCLQILGEMLVFELQYDRNLEFNLFQNLEMKTLEKH